MDRIITIGMAEDHLVFRQGMISLLKEEKSIEVLYDVENGLELLHCIEKQRPDAVLLDIEMPVMDGYDTFKRIKHDYPEVRVIMLTTHFHPTYILAYLKEGACAFLPKGAGIDEIVRAIHAVYNNGFYHGTKVREILERFEKTQADEEARFLKAGLTDREVEILKMLREGKQNEDIVRDLKISLRTVEWHRRNLNHKLIEAGMGEMMSWSKRNMN
jgi:DNA-binding NarL/FixJ family response regulator